MRHHNTRPHLTAAQRGRLRPTIDVRALERFLAVVPRESRRFYFLACTQTVTNAELEAVGIIPPPPDAPGEPATTPRAQRGKRSVRAPAQPIHFVLHHVPDPELDRLWQEVERSVESGA
ncbi:MAG TPA: hypothetical protein VG454_16355 [Gemmatimonadales bacterium]|nr:hypothetical protein [Gemmatimonadales bacterium]